MKEEKRVKYRKIYFDFFFLRHTSCIFETYHKTFYVRMFWKTDPKKYFMYF